MIVIEEELNDWVWDMFEKNASISDRLLTQKARKLLQNLKNFLLPS